MTWIVFGGIAAFCAFVATLVAQRRAAAFSETVYPIVRDRGPLTLPQLLATLGLSGFQARGKVTMALAALIKQNRVQEHDAPPGTPQLKKVDARTYSATS